MSLSLKLELKADKKVLVTNSITNEQLDFSFSKSKSAKCSKEQVSLTFPKGKRSLSEETAVINKKILSRYSNL
ncbi:MAG: hypothetical protein QNJ34_18080 [Xenococcaceae cyanobacterium MO_188.B29]|nr:hypothetical protein [Xenococcaceae cyanobacterium MO_188.B29]